MHERAARLAPTSALLEVVDLCEALGERIAASPTLPLASVQRVEAELGASIPDDVLTVIACRSSILRTATRLSLDELLEFEDEWSRGVPESHVAIAAVYHEPFAERFEGAHGGPYHVLAIPKRGPVTRTELLVVTDGSVDGEPTTLAAFARDKIESYYRHHDDGRAALVRSGKRSRCEPRLVGPAAATATLRERWVTHPKLGRGRLVEVRDDKWVVEFTSGMKILKRSVFDDEPAITHEAKAPKVPTVPDHPRWEEFAARLARAGVDPLRDFYAQADSSKGHDADGWAYRMRDADARVRTTLRVLRELTGKKLPSVVGDDARASETWTSPAECFRAATR